MEVLIKIAMDIIIKNTTEFEKAIEIAMSLPEYFNEQGLKEIKEKLSTQNVFGAYFNDELVGFASYKKINNETVELAWLAISTKYQGQGIGRKLVEESLAIESKDFSVCQVKTLAETVPDEGYAKTRDFYKKLGFIQTEIIDPYPGWGSGNPCQIFVKLIKDKHAEF